MPKVVGKMAKITTVNLLYMTEERIDVYKNPFSTMLEMVKYYYGSGYVMVKSGKIYHNHKQKRHVLQENFSRCKKHTGRLKYLLYEVLKGIYILLYKFTYYLSLVPLRLYDILHGTEYAGIEKPRDESGRFEYYPSPTFAVPFLRRYIRKHMQNGSGHSVLDIGCGKGFILRFFSLLNFDLVSGIEYDENLCRLARTNLKKVSKPVAVYQVDALDFTMYKDYDTFYIYNPFDERILKKCMRKIISSLEVSPRNITVFYCNPIYGECLKENGFKEEGHFYMTTIFTLKERNRK